MAPTELRDDAASKEFRVGADTNPRDLAEALDAALRNGERVVMTAIGHGAAGQAIKAVPILNTRHVNRGVVYMVLPTLQDRPIERDGVSRTMTVTCMRLVPWTVGD